MVAAVIEGQGAALLGALWGSLGEGVGFIAAKTPDGFRHVPVKTTDEASQKATELSGKGYDVYHACAVFNTVEGGRKAANARGARALPLDLDCGPGKDYPTQNDAASALAEFCKTVGLPLPTHIVNSGNGVHAYWMLGAEIPAAEWKRLAEKLKALTAHHGLRADPTRTADIASLLRPPGTMNYKNPNAPKPVKLLRAAPPLSAAAMRKTIENAYAAIDKAPGPAGNDVLIASGSDKYAPYPFDDERENFLSAASAAVNGRTLDMAGYKGFYDWTCACCFLVTLHKWPESETRRIFSAVCDLAPDADKTDNEKLWGSTLAATREKVDAGKDVTTHLTILKLARAAGWKPTKEADNEPEWVREVNLRYFVALFGGKVAIFRESSGAYEPMGVDSFKLLLANRTVTVSAGNETRMKRLADAWIQHPKRREYQGVGFYPGMNAPDEVFNLWRGWPTAPAAGDVQPAINHIRAVICGGNERLYRWIIRWLARLVQHPNGPGEVALVLIGGRGTGKSMFANWIKAMFGRYGLSVARGDLLTGRFTAHLESTVLLVVEEGVWGGDKHGEGALKHLVTSDSITIERKGFDAYEAPNNLHIVITSNEAWVIPAGHDERRFVVCDVSDERQGDHEYFARLVRWAENGGIAALLDYLLKLDLSGFNVRAVPDTAGLRDQKLLSLDPPVRWVLQRLELGSMVGDAWAAEVPAAAMTADFAIRMGLNDREKRQAETRLGMTLRKIFPCCQKRRRVQDGKREYVVTFPPTLEEARQQFEQFARLPGYEWEGAE